MSAPNIKDLATSLVIVAPSPANSGNTLTVTGGEGVRYPATPFDAIVHPADQLPTLDNAEQVLVTDITGNQLTFTRAQGLTTAKNIAVGWRISNGIFSAHITGAYARANHTGTQDITTIDGLPDQLNALMPKAGGEFTGSIIGTDASFSLGVGAQSFSTTLDISVGQDLYVSRNAYVSGGAYADNLTITNNVTAGGNLNLASSYPSDDVLGGTDGTRRLNLTSYQRANYNGFGETIRHFLARKDAKAMEAYYVPKLGYDGDRNAIADFNPDGTPADITQWQPVSWTGAHFEANDHGSNHVHWELEGPDSLGQMQGRLEMQFADPVTGQIGLDKTFLLTNLTDFVVRTSNNQVLRLASPAGNHMPIEFNHDAYGSSSFRRWQLRANSTAESGSDAGTDFQLTRYSDDGTFLDSPIFVKRSTGYIGFGTINASARITLAESTTSAGGILFGADTSLYRSATTELTTNSKFVAGGGLKIGSSSTTGYVWTATDTAGNGSWQAASGSGSVAWGSITGTLSSQTDLQTALNAKEGTITTLPVSKGGTGLNTLTSGNVLTASSSSSIATSKAAPSGAFVGTSDAQTLTNKIISGSSNTVSNIAQSSVTNLSTDLAAKAADNAVVHLTGNETVAGVKTFSSSPVVPAPTTDLQAATKKYVDDSITAGGGYTDEQAKDAVGAILTDTAEIDLSYNDAGETITASLVAGSIDETKLDTSVNASLDLADSAVQPGDLATVATSGDYNDLSNKPDLSALNDVVVAVNTAAFPGTGTTGFVYIAEDTGYMYRWNGSSYTQLTDQTAIWGQISGTLSNQTDLNTALSGKASTSHGHAISDVTSLQTELDGKQALDATLTALAGLSITGFAAIGSSGTAASSRTITAGSSKISITNGNGASGNPTIDLGTVATSDITGLDTALAGKASTSHTHTASQVTDFDTEVSNNTDVAANTAARHTHANTAVLNATTASFTTADEAKLDGVADGATANSSDATLLARANHTGTQTASTISDFSTAADARIAAANVEDLANVTISSPSNGQVLKYSGGVWINDADQTGSSSSGITRSIVITSGSATMGSTSTTDYVYLVAGAHTMTLPTAVSNTNRYTVKNVHSADITVDTTSSQTIDGSTSITIAPEDAVDLISDNTNWRVI